MTLRFVTMTAVMALTLPALAFAQPDDHRSGGEHHGDGRPGGAPHAAPAARPAPQAQPNAQRGGPGGGGQGAAPRFQGRPQGARPFDGRTDPRQFQERQADQPRGGFVQRGAPSQPADRRFDGGRAGQYDRYQGGRYDGGRYDANRYNGGRYDGGHYNGGGRYNGGGYRGQRRPGGQAFNYGGRNFYRYRAAPYRYPYGYYARGWRRGEWLPQIFITPNYFIDDWYDFDLVQPYDGYQWIRVGDDALLVDLATGRIVDEVPGVYYDD